MGLAGVGRLSIELARERPGIQLLRFDGVLGRESGFDPGIPNPAGGPAHITTSALRTANG